MPKIVQLAILSEMSTFQIGSTTAKGGFANERAIAKKFNNWKKDVQAQLWLKIMGYDVNKLDSVEAVIVPRQKTDIQVKIIIVTGKIIKVENLSLKKANSDANFNQVDKRWVDSYQEMWKFDDEIARGLKLFTGEIAAAKNIISKLRDKRRMYLDELPENLRNKIINFFKDNKILVITDVLKGRGPLSADWMMVTMYDKKYHTTTFTLKDINTAMNFFGSGDVTISPKGSIYIGRVTMMRKGGDAGRKTAQMLQFKINPCELFQSA